MEKIFVVSGSCGMNTVEMVTRRVTPDMERVAKKCLLAIRAMDLTDFDGNAKMWHDDVGDAHDEYSRFISYVEAQVFHDFLPEDDGNTITVIDSFKIFEIANESDVISSDIVPNDAMKQLLEISEKQAGWEPEGVTGAQQSGNWMMPCPVTECTIANCGHRTIHKYSIACETVREFVACPRPDACHSFY